VTGGREATFGTGDVVSMTVTVKDLLAVLPCASAALQVTVVVPRTNVLPAAGVQLTATLPSTMSTASAVDGSAGTAALVASAVRLAGTVTTGGLASLTVTVKDWLAVFPCASVALQVTVVVPRTNVLPAAGVQLTATLPSTMSTA